MTRVVIFMAIVMAMNFGLLPLALGGILGLFLLLPILAFTHHLLPPAARQFGRMVTYITSRLKHAW